MSFSRQLLRGLVGLIAFFSLLLLMAVGLQQERLESRAYEGDDRFVPAAQVSRLVALSQQLAAQASADAATLAAAQAALVGACEARPLAVVLGRLQSAAGDSASGAAGDKASPVDWSTRVALAWQAHAQSHAQALSSHWRTVSCGPFLRDLALVAQNPAWLTPRADEPQRALVAQSLAERVSWTSLPPCLFGQDSNGQNVLLSGPRARCGLAAPAASPPRLSRDLANWMAPRAMVTDAVDGQSASPRQLRLSLSGPLQQQLEAFMPQAARSMRGLSMVVIDPATMGILAMGCEGAACDQRGIEGSKPLAAALVEAPPASVAKLFFSLAFAESVSSRDLQLQIKTSGQLDDEVEKRNEWWERAAICNLGATPRVPVPCAMPMRVSALVAQAGWSGERANLSGARLPVPGQFGRIPLGAGEAADMREPVLLFDWRSYEDVRAGRARAPRDRAAEQAYLRTSSLVQSVLGAGDARATAVGVASLAAQISNAARGRASAPVWLLRDDAVRPPARPGLQNRRAAEVVQAGMAKVMMPAEPGWKGSGTAHPAVEAAFGRSCKEGCPLRGKTGTVGRADVGFGGTTVFAGLVDVTQLTTWLGIEPPAHWKGMPKELALGVIAFPQGIPPAGSGHAASRQAMAWLAALAREQEEP
ncbi:MAG: hypothetical protein ACO37H_04740 [Burkholderiaceae bacterium]